jgi:hypothetical protein
MIKRGFETSTEELLAVVSDVEVSTDTPVYRPDQIGKIADLLESYREK